MCILCTHHSLTARCYDKERVELDFVTMGKALVIRLDWTHNCHGSMLHLLLHLDNEDIIMHRGRLTDRRLLPGK